MVAAGEETVDSGLVAHILKVLIACALTHSVLILFDSPFGREGSLAE